jgi:hypothetical protein
VCFALIEMPPKKVTGLKDSSFDAPVAGAAGKRTVTRPLRLNSDDDLPSTRKRQSGKVLSIYAGING